MKRKINKRGIAIITVIGIAFVLLALASVLMINSYAHMSMSQRYLYEAEALNVAEGGAAVVIHELENCDTLNNIPSYKKFDETNIDNTIGKGTFVAEFHNNLLNGNYDSSNNIPPYSISIKSKGTVFVGGNKYEKSVYTLLTYQLVPSSVSSEGTIRMNTASDETLAPGEDFSALPSLQDTSAPSSASLKSYSCIIDSVDGFVGNLHSNFNTANIPTYRCRNTGLVDDPNPNSGYVHLDVKGGTFSSSGQVGGEASAKIQNHGGQTLENLGKKEYPSMNFASLKNKAESSSPMVSIADNIPDHILTVKVTFLGKMRNKGGVLEGYVNLDGILVDEDVWVPCSSYLPDGMDWKSSTGTLEIEEGKNFDWNGDLSLEDVNIDVEGDKGSGLFVDGNISADNIEITGNSFSLASNDKDISLNNACLNVTANEKCDGIAIYCKNLNIMTKLDKIPSGGNKFKGVVYAKNGKINLTNQYTGTTDNKFTLEGLVINPSPDVTEADQDTNTGLRVWNTGDASFSISLTYNPFVAPKFFSANKDLSVELQPLFWDIE